MSNLHTQVRCFVWGVKIFGSRAGGIGGSYGVNMNHMITLESLENSYFLHIFYLLFYLS